MPKLVLRRLADNWMLLLSIFAGITFAATLVAAAPVYLRSLERLALNLEIDRLGRPTSNVVAFAFNVPITHEALTETESEFNAIAEEHLGPLQESRLRYLIVSSYMASTPARPIAAPGQQQVRAPWNGYLRSMSDLDRHVHFVEGRMAEEGIADGPRGPVLEVVISSATARYFELDLNDVVALTTETTDPTRISGRVVGIMEANDPVEDFWAPHASVYIDPAPEREEISATGEVTIIEPEIPIFTTQAALASAVSSAYPGTPTDSIWIMLTDPQVLKRWDRAETQGRLVAFENELADVMPGMTETSTGIEELLQVFERRTFFSRVPLLLLQTIMALTTLFFLVMMVAYLVQSRQGDASLMRTRGIGLAQLIRLYTIEGVFLTVVAAALAPFLAMGAVALAGILPYFSEMTGGGLLPIVLDPAPFIAAGLTGLLCLAVFVVPGTWGARGGLLVQKLGASRPPAMPFVQRYYIDLGLLALGGVIFWELYTRGELVSGGLFGDANVNEPLVMAPVLFLIAVALLFMRLFPLVVKYVAGESQQLVHLVAGAAVVSLAVTYTIPPVLDGGYFEPFTPLLLLLLFSGAYIGTARASMAFYRVAGIVAQAGIATLFLWTRPIDRDDLVYYIPSLALIASVVMQAVFDASRLAFRSAPVWVSLSLWHMARNPLQYTWVVLLLVLVTGMGILATTVGGTLEQGQTDRVHYDVGADVRVSQIDRQMAGDPRAETLRSKYRTLPGVTGVSVAYREGRFSDVDGVELLAIEPREFQFIGWYRDDFSRSPLNAVMQALRSYSQAPRIGVPDDAAQFGLWAKTDDAANQFPLRAVLSNDLGDTTVVTLGRVDSTDWKLLRGQIPASFDRPAYLVSVQIYEPGLGPAPSTGTVLLDDIHTVARDGDTESIVESFEGFFTWEPIITSSLASDRLFSYGDDAHSGTRSGLFQFGQANEGGVRGIYQSPTAGPVPVVASSTYMQRTGAQLGDTVVVQVGSRRVPGVIRDTVEYFPTMGSRPGGFLLADIHGLLSHINIISPQTSIWPNEMFISAAPAARTEVRRSIEALSFRTGIVMDRNSRLEAVRQDPLTNAGWSSLVVVSLGVAVVAAGIGYATYLLTFSGRSRNEMGFLKSLGLSRRQMLSLLACEHIAIAIVGLVLGTWAGFQMSRMMVSSVVVTDTGDPIVPPYISTTDWLLMAPAYLAILAIFGAALFLLDRSIRRINVSKISRMEGL